MYLVLCSAVDGHAERSTLHHQRHDFVEHICGSHGGVFGIRVVSRRDFDDIRSDKIDSLKTTDDGAQLSGTPATGFRSAGSVTSSAAGA